MSNGLKMSQILNYKVLLLTAFVSVNANADIFSDIGDWVSDNKTITAVVGIGALTAASVAIKPLSGLFREEAAAIEASGLSGIAEGEAMNVSAIDISASEVSKLPKVRAGGSLVRLDVLQDGAMVDVKAVERMKEAQRAAQETNRIEAAEQLKAIRAQPPRKMPWQQKPIFRPLANAEEINADKEFADGILNELGKLNKY